MDLFDTLREEGILEVDGVIPTLENLKSGLGKSALSRINEALKEKGLDSGYARQKLISYYVFDSD